METIRLLGPDDLALVCAAGTGVFDFPVRRDAAAAFLADAGHLMVAAIAGDGMIGFASAAILRHPDKAPALFIAEVGVREDRQREGIGLALVSALIDEGRARGCMGAWVATEDHNTAARALYARAGGRETAGIVVWDWDGAMDHG